MRDKKRIKEFLTVLQEFWEENSDLRFGQVIYLLADNLDSKNRDIFFPEEDEWTRAIGRTETVFTKRKHK
jgi:hypothetical protein